MEEEIVPTQETPQRESTTDDYWNVFNGFHIQATNPELRFNTTTDVYGTIDYDDPEFADAYGKADIATKRNMVLANNKEDALKIAGRTDVFNESQRAVQEDSLITQFAMGVIPSLASPTTLIPGGALWKAGALASKVNRVSSLAIGGAVGGAAAAGLDEAIFDAQGMPTNYMGSMAIGAIFGGGIGMLSGALTGPYSKATADALHKDNDTFINDFSVDPHMNTRLDEDGVLIFQDPAQMDKSLVDRMPLLGGWLRSDVHTGLQAESQIVRSMMLRISSGTVSSRDASGNLMPVNKTGVDFGYQLDGLQNRLSSDVTNSFVTAREGGYKGTRDDFNADVYRVYITELNSQRKNATAYANTKTAHIQLEGIGQVELSAFKKAHNSYIDEWYNANKPQFRGDAHINKAAEGYRNYYQKMLESGQKLEMKGLGSSAVNRLYAPRIYNYKAIKDGTIDEATVRSQIREALINDTRNNLNTPEHLEIAVSDIHKMLLEGEFNTHITSPNFKMDADVPFDSRLKNRKYYLDETFMPSLLRDDFEAITGGYHYGMKGRQSTQFAFGTDSVSEIMDKVRQDHIEKGMEVAGNSLDALKRTIEDLQGQLRIHNMSDTPQWTWTRNLSTFNSVRMGGGFGVNQAVETAAVVMMSGMDTIMSGRLKHSLRQSKDMLYNKESGDEFGEFLLNSGFLSTSLHTHRVNRFADGESSFMAGKMENSLNGLSDGLQKYNGMRYFMSVMEDYAGAAVGTKLMKGKVTPTELARWGLTPEQGKALGTKLKSVKTDKAWDLHKLDTDTLDSFQLAVSRGIREIAVQGDSIHLPAWFKVQGPMSRLLFQFMRFPLVAQEVLFRKGFNEAQGQMVAGMFASSMMYMSINYLREEAAIAAGLKKNADREFDIFNRKEDFENALLKSLNYNAPLGFMASVWNYGAIASGQPELGRDWQSKNGMSSLMGPTGGLGEDVIQLIRAGVNGELDSERSFSRFKGFLPFMNAPLLNEGGKTLIEEYGR